MINVRVFFTAREISFLRGLKKKIPQIFHGNLMFIIVNKKTQIFQKNLRYLFFKKKISQIFKKI